jgi:hypothetical protein
MTIRNCDGTPFQLSGSLNVFDPTNPDQFLLNSLDSEIIDIAGIPILYYEVFVQKQTIDPLYREDRGKLWSNNPVQLQGLYDPIPSQNFLNMFGIDAPDELQIQFNYQAVLKAIGHPPKIGSRLFTVHKAENWVIVQRNVGDFFLWGEYRLTLICQRFQESVTTGEGRVSQNNDALQGGTTVNNTNLFQATNGTTNGRSGGSCNNNNQCK